MGGVGVVGISEFSQKVILCAALKVLGQVASDDGEHFELTLHFGSLTLDRLAVGSAVYPGPVTISAGQTVRW